MNRDEFIKKTALFAAGVSLMSFYSCSTTDRNNNVLSDNDTNVLPIYTLPALGYAYSALAPTIDAETMEIHHTKHHAGYVKKLNKALENYNGNVNTLPQLFAAIKENEDDDKLRQNGGGHYNHSLFWEVLDPTNSPECSPEFKAKINSKFGSVDELKTKMIENVFGSGWTWLSVDDKGELFLSSTPNQDNPLMKNLVTDNGTPILGIDVWEHAYYLNYQNERKQYLENIMDIVNWKKVEEKYLVAIG